MHKLAIVMAALLVMGHKCGKPGSPKAEAAETVEEAWWMEGVEDALDRHPDAAVEVVLDGDDAVVVFRRQGDEIAAFLMLAGERHAFLVEPDGSVVTPEE
jgi:hypothetical protein